MTDKQNSADPVGEKEYTQAVDAALAFANVHKATMTKLHAELTAMRARITALEAHIAAEPDRMRAVVERFERHATYPVSTDINPRGYGWRPEDSLDFALGELKAAAIRAQETGQ